MLQDSWKNFLFRTGIAGQGLRVFPRIPFDHVALATGREC